MDKNTDQSCNFLDLTTEQEFQLLLLSRDIDKMPENQLRLLTKAILKQGMIRENFYKQALKGGLNVKK